VVVVVERERGSFGLSNAWSWRPLGLPCGSGGGLQYWCGKIGVAVGVGGGRGRRGGIGDIGFRGGSHSSPCCVNKGMGMLLGGGLGLRGHAPCSIPSQITSPAYFQKLIINTIGLEVFSFIWSP